MQIRNLTEELRRIVLGEAFFATEEIRLDPEKLFFFVELPAPVKKRLTAIAKQVVKGTDYKAEENDHITLLYIPRFKEPVSKELRTKVMEAAKKVAAESPPIKATLQGWGYFDGAEGKDNEPATALVGLIDAPGLAHVHVALHQAVKGLGIDAKQNHGFCPHATFAYLPKGGRIPKLPVLDEKFEISGFELSNDRQYSFPLKG